MYKLLMKYNFHMDINIIDNFTNHRQNNTHLYINNLEDLIYFIINLYKQHNYYLNYYTFNIDCHIKYNYYYHLNFHNNYLYTNIDFMHLLVETNRY